jgi:hypothetical protein
MLKFEQARCFWNMLHVFEQARCSYYKMFESFLQKVPSFWCEDKKTRHGLDAIQASRMPLPSIVSCVQIKAHGPIMFA